MPRDYRKIQDAIDRAQKKGLEGDDAMLTAFRESVAG